MLNRYLGQWKSDAYKQSFPWVDQIHAVRSPLLLGTLNEKLLERLTKKECERLWLSIPEIVDWTVIDGFRYRAVNASPVRDDVRIQDYLEEVKPNKLDLPFLKRRQIQAVSANSDVIHEWSVYRCLYCETELSGETYLLTNGKWYRIGGDFLARVNASYDAVPPSTLKLPDYKDKSEGAYNERVAKELPKQPR